MHWDDHVRALDKDNGCEMEEWTLEKRHVVDTVKATKNNLVHELEEPTTILRKLNQISQKQPETICTAQNTLQNNPKQKNTTL